MKAHLIVGLVLFFAVLSASIDATPQVRQTIRQPQNQIPQALQTRTLLDQTNAQRQRLWMDRCKMAYTDCTTQYSPNKQNDLSSADSPMRGLCMDIYQAERERLCQTRELMCWYNECHPGMDEVAHIRGGLKCYAADGSRSEWDAPAGADCSSAMTAVLSSDYVIDRVIDRVIVSENFPQYLQTQTNLIDMLTREDSNILTGADAKYMFSILGCLVRDAFPSSCDGVPGNK